ncbi:MAG: aspartyl/asparaginyl beta-hydroxylase domain-containing protein [Geminicoccaceae bacterium]
MDIGVPLRDLGPVDVSAIMSIVNGLTEADWTGNTFRQDALAASVHSVTDNILMKTEWHPSATSTGIGHFEDLVHVWAKERGLDPKQYLPIAREDTDVWPVYTMPDWLRYRDALQPIVDQVLGYLRQPGGVVTRLALVRLRGSANIAPHIDQHAMAAKAHRIHVSLSDSPSVVYKIGGRKFTMRLGRAYDFNNRVRHSVRNNGRQHRVNIFIDYYANPGLVIRNPFDVSAPIFEKRTPVIN